MNIQPNPPFRNALILSRELENPWITHDILAEKGVECRLETDPERLLDLVAQEEFDLIIVSEPLVASWNWKRKPRDESLAAIEYMRQLRENVGPKPVIATASFRRTGSLFLRSNAGVGWPGEDGFFEERITERVWRELVAHRLLRGIPNPPDEDM